MYSICVTLHIVLSGKHLITMLTCMDLFFWMNSTFMLQQIRRLRKSLITCFTLCSLLQMNYLNMIIKILLIFKHLVASLTTYCLVGLMNNYFMMFQCGCIEKLFAAYVTCFIFQLWMHTLLVIGNAFPAMCGKVTSFTRKCIFSYVNIL